jgi:hypothetical protein
MTDAYWSTPADEIQYQQFTIKIYPDPDTENPLTAFEPLGKLVALDGEHDHLNTARLADYGIYEEYGTYFRETPTGQRREIDKEDIPATIEKHTRAVVYTFTSRGYSQGDYYSGMMLATPEEIRAEYGASRTARQTAREYLKGQATEFGYWLWGDTYRWTLEYDGEDIESVGGYYGIESAREAAQEQADEYADEPQYLPQWEEPYALTESAH